MLPASRKFSWRALLATARSLANVARTGARQGWARLRCYVDQHASRRLRLAPSLQRFLGRAELRDLLGAPRKPGDARLLSHFLPRVHSPGPLCGPSVPTLQGSDRAARAQGRRIRGAACSGSGAAARDPAGASRSPPRPASGSAEVLAARDAGAVVAGTVATSAATPRQGGRSAGTVPPPARALDSSALQVASSDARACVARCRWRPSSSTPSRGPQTVLRPCARSWQV